MAKQATINWKALREPFPSGDVEWRIQQSGANNGKPWATVMAYLTSRAVQTRLDDVVGPDRWRNEFDAGPCGGVICSIGIYTDGGEWVVKWDGAENTDVEAVKGGLSDAMKRAAVQWGIGRYLYSLGVRFAQIVPRGTPGSKNSKLKDGTPFSWIPPQLPSWATTPEKCDAKWVTSMCDPALAFSMEQIEKLATVIDGDTSVNATTREVAKARLREIYRAKKETGDGGGDGGVGDGGAKDAGGTEGLLPQPAAATTVEGEDLRASGGQADQAV